MCNAELFMLSKQKITGTVTDNQTFNYKHVTSTERFMAIKCCGLKKFQERPQMNKGRCVWYAAVLSLIECYLRHREVIQETQLCTMPTNSSQSTEKLKRDGKGGGLKPEKRVVTATMAKESAQLHAVTELTKSGS